MNSLTVLYLLDKVSKGACRGREQSESSQSQLRPHTCCGVLNSIIHVCIQKLIEEDANDPHDISKVYLFAAGIVADQGQRSAHEPGHHHT